MATDGEMMVEIGKVIERFGPCQDKPPLTEEQLVIMAILSIKKPLTAREVYDWVVDKFVHYQRLAREALWGQPYLLHYEDTSSACKMAVKFRNNLEKAFWQYEIPFKVERTEDNAVRYNISITQGRQLLSSVLDSQDTAKTFPFFKLPPEIRNRIYEHLFQYPDTGVMLVQQDEKVFTRFGGVNRQLAVISRSVEEEFSIDKWQDHTNISRSRLDSPYLDKYLRTRLLKDILAPLATNRQFYEEAMPLFYNLNRFCFDRAYDLTGPLQALAPGRRKHIKHISFRFARMKHVVSPAQELVHLEGLRKLDIWFQRGAAEIVGGVLDAPGLDDLCRVRGLDAVTLGGDCETIRSRVTESLLRPRDSSVVTE